MSLLITPLWQNLNGDPRTGVSPPSLVMLSGRLTPQRHGEIQQIYMHFSTAKLTAVGDYFVFNRVLSDGTRVRIESMQGRDRVFVWASDAEQASEWEYGWAFIPVDKDSPESGYVRKPGTGQGGLNRDSFRAYVATDGTRNFTFVDGKTGKRSVSDGRMGGERIWRGPQNKGEILTYDRDYVYYRGVRISSHLEGVKFPITISGAAIAKGVDGYWIVIISANSVLGLMAAMRLPKVGAAREIKGRFVDCGEAIEQTTYSIGSIWNFSPDGLNAVCVGAAPDGTTVLHKIKLNPAMGLVPFTVTSEMDVSYQKLQRVVSNEFAPEEAKRILRWYGWRDFSFRYTRRYYAVYPHFVAGQFGAVASNENDAQPGYTSDSIQTEIDRGGVVNLTTGMFLYNDGDIPNEGLEAGSDNRGRFAFADKFLSELDIQYSYQPPPNQTGPGDERQSVRLKRDYLGAVVTYEIYNSYTPVFGSVAELVNFCEAKWNDPKAVAPNSLRNALFNRINDITGIIGDRRPGTKTDYKDLTEAALYIRDSGGFILDPNTNFGNLLNGSTLFQTQGSDITYIDRGIRVISAEEKQAIEDREDVEYNQRRDIKTFDWVNPYGDVLKKRLSANIQAPIFDSTPNFKMIGGLIGKPDYTNNYVMRWTFRSELAIQGSKILAAGYDKNGKLSVIHIEADPNQKVTYVSEIVANDETHPKRKTTYSGGYGGKLKINDVVIDEFRFSVEDSFEGVLTEENTDGMGHYIPKSGVSPRLGMNNVYVWDVDEYLGHVLYRKFESAATAVGQASEERPTQYSISFHDYLYTPTGRYTLGEKQTYSAPQRKMPQGSSSFASTEDAMQRFNYGLSGFNKAVVDGIEFRTADFDYVFDEKLKQIIPEDQKNPRENLYGWDDKRYDPWWVRNTMFLFSGANGDPYRHPSPIVHRYAVDTSEAVAFGRFESPPAARIALRSFSDDVWMVCVCEETNTVEVHKEKTIAGFFIKTGKESSIKKVDAARDFPFLLSESPKLLRPTFYIGLKK